MGNATAAVSRAKIVKYLLGDFTELKYKVVDFAPEDPDAELPFTLYYETSFNGRWQYCGDFGSLADAEYYMKCWKCGDDHTVSKRSLYYYDNTKCGRCYL